MIGDILTVYIHILVHSVRSDIPNILENGIAETKLFRNSSRQGGSYVKNIDKLDRR